MMEHRDIFVGVADCGVGNIGNVARALARIGARHGLFRTPGDFRAAGANFLLLPGVGAFGEAMSRLEKTGWADAAKNWAEAGRPMIGICVGMQLMCDGSEEGGETRGLGIFGGTVKRLDGLEKIPHMGWNSVEWNGSPFGGAEEFAPRDLYFVHSYAALSSPHAAGETEAGSVRFVSAARRGRAAGFQFHPERSGPRGVEFLGRVIEFLAREENGDA